MNNELKKKYGLITAICMVVGIVIGSGVFFKATPVFTNNGGNMIRSLLTVIVVGALMTICAYTFSILAGRHSKINGIVDYAEAEVGEGLAYSIGWFLSIIYYPVIASTLAWVSANYTCSLFEIDNANVRLLHGVLPHSFIHSQYTFSEYFGQVPSIHYRYQAYPSRDYGYRRYCHRSHKRSDY